MSQKFLFSRILDIVFIVMILNLVAVKNTHAYIDPGSGSYLLQIIAAGFLSSIFIIKKFRGNINKFIYSFLKKIRGQNSR